MDKETKNKFIEMCKTLPECNAKIDMEKLKNDKKLIEKLKKAIL